MNVDMRDIEEIRRTNAKLILEQRFQGKKARMAEAMGKQSSYLSRILEKDAAGARGIGDTLAREIEIVGGKQENWLDHEHEQHHVEIHDGITVSARPGLSLRESSAVYAMPTRGRVPVVSWVIAGPWAQIEDSFLPNEGYEWLETSEKLSEHEAVALLVEGDSMYRPEDPNSFEPGCFIVVKRVDLRTPRSGDFVVVRLENEQRSTFKQLMYDGDQMYLKALNPAYKTLLVDRPATIVGVVVEKVTRRRY